MNLTERTKRLMNDHYGNYYEVDKAIEAAVAEERAEVKRLRSALGRIDLALRTDVFAIIDEMRKPGRP